MLISQGARCQSPAQCRVQQSSLLRLPNGEPSGFARSAIIGARTARRVQRVRMKLRFMEGHFDARAEETRE